MIRLSIVIIGTLDAMKRRFEPKEKLQSFLRSTIFLWDLCCFLMYNKTHTKKSCYKEVHIAFVTGCWELPYFYSRLVSPRANGSSHLSSRAISQHRRAMSRLPNWGSANHIANSVTLIWACICSGIWYLATWNRVMKMNECECAWGM